MFRVAADGSQIELDLSPNAVHEIGAISTMEGRSNAETALATLNRGLTPETGEPNIRLSSQPSL